MRDKYVRFTQGAGVSGWTARHGRGLSRRRRARPPDQRLRALVRAAAPRLRAAAPRLRVAAPWLLALIMVVAAATGSARAQTEVDDAATREYTVFRGERPVAFTDASSRELTVFGAQGQVQIEDATSREFTVFGSGAVPEMADALSREFTVFRAPVPTEIADAFSREFTVFRAPVPTEMTDAFSREFTVFNDTLDVRVADAMSREVSVFNYVDSGAEIADAHSREYAIWNLTPAEAGEPEERPGVLTLLPARPNPFGGSTMLRFGLPTETAVTLEVFDVAGRKVETLLKERTVAAGWHGCIVDGSRWSSGVYFYRLTAGPETRKGELIITR